ncbi:MAG: efflux RND transporter periplasmic adaptor subunit [Chromatiales bacterium]
MKKNILSLTLGLAIAMPFVVTPAVAAEEQYAPVQLSRDIPTVSLGGTVVPFKEVTLAAQLPGRVKFIAGIEGDSFEEKVLLVALDESELQAKSNAAYAQLANAESSLRNAGVQYTREYYSPQSSQSMGGMGVPNLFDQMFTKPMEGFMGTRSRSAERGADLYASQTRIEQAKMSIVQAQAEIQALDAKMRDAKSVAPFEGVIMKKFVEVGDTVQPGQQLLQFASLEYLQIVVDVPSRLSPGLTDGMMLLAELDISKQRVPVRVAQIYPMADAQRHTIKVKFDLPQGISAPGMYAKVLVPDFNAPSTELPVIPTSAIRYNGSLPGVYVKGKDGNPELRLIRVGEELGRGYTSVLSGVKAGEQVLANPKTSISAGWSSGDAIVSQ